MCGNFEGQVTGDPVLACWCHCTSCRKQTGAAMQLGVWPDIQILNGKDDLIQFELNAGSGVVRHSCTKCGAFCYKILPSGKVAPLGALVGGSSVKPTCHIFVADKGDQDIMFPELPQHDAFP